MNPERREERYVKIHLTASEIKDEGEKLAREIQEIELAESDAKAAAKSRKEAIEMMQSNASNRARLIRLGYREEKRDVLVIYNAKAGVKSITNPESGEVYSEEAIEPNEVLPLPLGAAKKKDEKPS